MPAVNLRIWKRGLAVAVTAAFIALVACEDVPSEPAAPGWVAVANFPPEALWVNAVSDTAGVYAAGGPNFYSCNLIFGFRDGAFEVQHAAPENVCFYDLTVSYNTPSYAVGEWVGENYDRRPYILRKPHLEADWERLNVPNLPDTAALRVVTSSDGGGWLLLGGGYTGTPGEPRAGKLAKFAENASRVFYELGTVTFAYSPRPPWPGVAYAVEYPGGTRVFISPDGGASWTEEKLPSDAARGRVITSAYAAAVEGRDLYVVAVFDDGATAILRRTGEPGAGEYEPVFISPVGPYFVNISGVAFREMASSKRPGRPYGISCDGVAVGAHTAVVYDEGLWRQERLAVPTEFYGVVPRTGNGYTAWGRDLGIGGMKLYYHP